jgi:hypothetical protein
MQAREAAAYGLVLRKDEHGPEHQIRNSINFSSRGHVRRGSRSETSLV